MDGGGLYFHGEIRFPGFAMDAEKVFFVHVAPRVGLGLPFLFALLCSDPVDGICVDVPENAGQSHAIDHPLAEIGVAGFPHFAFSVHVRVKVDGDNGGAIDVFHEQGNQGGMGESEVFHGVAFGAFGAFGEFLAVGRE